MKWKWEWKGKWKGIKIFFILCLCTMSTSAWSLCTKSRKVNFRSGPGTHYKKTWTVSKYMPLEKISESPLWYQVKDFEKNYHWVLKSLVTSKYKCVVVKRPWVSLRVGPGKNFSRNRRYPKAEKYVTFRYLSEKNNWVHIKDKKKYWVYKSLVWIR